MLKVSEEGKGKCPKGNKWEWEGAVQNYSKCFQLLYINEVDWSVQCMYIGDRSERRELNKLVRRKYKT